MCFGAARYSRSTARITDRHYPMREARRAIVVALHRIIEHSLHVRSSWCRLRSNMARADPLSSSMLTHGVVVGRDV
jgi:hypothetical protein